MNMPGGNLPSDQGNGPGNLPDGCGQNNAHVLLAHAIARALTLADAGTLLNQASLIEGDGAGWAVSSLLNYAFAQQDIFFRWQRIGGVGYLTIRQGHLHIAVPTESGTGPVAALWVTEIGAVERRHLACANKGAHFRALPFLQAIGRLSESL